jgi:hypothetical protein
MDAYSGDPTRVRTLSSPLPGEGAALGIHERAAFRVLEEPRLGYGILRAQVGHVLTRSPTT